MPQTSVAPTFKLTLPSEFVTGYLEHLVEKDFELVDDVPNGGSWEVTILPRKNKNKYEYTLQVRAPTQEHAGTLLGALLLPGKLLQETRTKR